MSVERIRRQFVASLPAELAEVLMPALRLRVVGDRLVVSAHSPPWIDALRSQAGSILARISSEAGLTLAIDDGGSLMAPALTFAGWREDPGNRLALAACRRVAQAPGIEHNPLYLHGPPGTGKSHLLAALVSEMAPVVGEGQVLMCSGDLFVSEWAPALARRQADPLGGRLKRAALVVIDGIDALASRTLAQEELFHLLNDGLERGAQIVVAGRQAPQRLPGFEDRIATRLAWGLTVALEPPSVETRLAVLLDLCPAAAAIDPGELAHLVDTYAPDMHQTVRLAERLAIGERPGQGNDGIGFDRILTLVAASYGVRPADIAGPGRERRISRARQATLLLGRRLTGHSLVALGGMVGGRDHATVLYAIRTAEARLAQDPSEARQVAELTRMILADEGRG
jgi:chromosomal replication initiator protein